jgi:flagellar hook-length control protein FliK
MLELIAKLRGSPTSGLLSPAVEKVPTGGLDFAQLLLQARQEEQEARLEGQGEVENEADEEPAVQGESPGHPSVEQDEEEEEAQAGETAPAEEELAEEYEPLTLVAPVLMEPAEETTSGEEAQAPVPLAAAQKVELEARPTMAEAAPRGAWATERTSAPELAEPVEEEAFQVEVPLLQGEEESSVLELLNLSELLDPELVVEQAPAPLLARLQQAQPPGSAPAPGLDDLAQAVLPQVIRGLATLVRNGAAEMRLQLQPPDLGEIELRVRTSEAIVRGEMMVQHPQIKQLLESQMERLRAALAGQGLELEGFDVNVERHSRHSREQADGQPWGRPAAGRRIPAENSAPPSPPARLGNHQVDYLV